jgi:hypothetical protein
VADKLAEKAQGRPMAEIRSTKYDPSKPVSGELGPLGHIFEASFRVSKAIEDSIPDTLPLYPRWKLEKVGKYGHEKYSLDDPVRAKDVKPWLFPQSRDEMILELAGGLGDAAKGVSLAVKAATGKGLGLAMVGPLYHGGAKKVTQFKDEFLRSGTGGQAQGAGHYLAQNPEVAGTYKEIMGIDAEVIVGGNSVEKLIKEVDDTEAEVLEDLRQEATNVVVEGLGTPQTAVNNLRRLYKKYQEFGSSKHYNHAEEKLRILDELETKGIEANEISGHVMTTDLPNLNEEDFLDWDASLSEQTTKVKKAIETSSDPDVQAAYKRSIQAAKEGEPHRGTGSGFYTELSKHKW